MKTQATKCPLMRKVFDKYEQAAGVIILLGLVYVIVISKTKEVKDQGVYTVAKVLSLEGAESGVNLNIEIYLNKNRYSAIVDYWCKDHCVGNFYYVKVLPGDPAKYPFLMGDKPVPPCILDSVKSFEGWSEIPACSTTEAAFEPARQHLQQ